MPVQTPPQELFFCSGRRRICLWWWQSADVSTSSKLRYCHLCITYRNVPGSSQVFQRNRHQPWQRLRVRSRLNANPGALSLVQAHCRSTQIVRRNFQTTFCPGRCVTLGPGTRGVHHLVQTDVERLVLVRAACRQPGFGPKRPFLGLVLVRHTAKTPGFAPAWRLDPAGPVGKQRHCLELDARRDRYLDYCPYSE